MYILLTGAPGSKWSSVAKSIYLSPDIDRSDSTSERSYDHGAVKHTGSYFDHGAVKHTGSYFDPGMEFDNHRDEWDKPFSGQGKRIIKSHTFAHQLDELKSMGHPIVMVYRSHLECLDWWTEAGGFDITYPDYKYYKDMDTMWTHIKKQNTDINRFIQANLPRIQYPVDNLDLCRVLGIKSPDRKLMIHNYADNDIKVYVYQ